MERYKNKRRMFRKGGKFAKAPTLAEQGAPVSEGGEICANCAYGLNEAWHPLLKTGYCPECKCAEKRPNTSAIVKSVNKLIRRLKLQNEPDTVSQNEFNEIIAMEGSLTVVVQDEDDAIVAMFGSPLLVESYIHAAVLCESERSAAVDSYKSIIEFINDKDCNKLESKINNLKDLLAINGFDYRLKDFIDDNPQTVSYKKPLSTSENWRMEVVNVVDIPTSEDFFAAKVREGFYQSEKHSNGNANERSFRSL